MIELRDIHLSFGPKAVLRGLNLEVAAGETLVMLGRSGTGKSVTLKMIVGLLRPDRGSVMVDDVNVATAPRVALRKVRRDVAYLFQTGALVNWMTVRDNVSLPLIERRELSKSAIRQRVDESLTSLDLLEAAEQFPAEISGGMAKRAALCRVLVQQPRAILYDEPTAGLDPILARTVAELIREVQSAGDRTALVVTHDLELAFAVADRIGLHNEGQLVEVGTPDEFRQSQHPVVRAFLDGSKAHQQGVRP